MKILVTGSNGFIAKNLIQALHGQNKHEVFKYDIDSQPSELDTYARECEFVFHLAGVNRPKDEKEFMEGNFGFTSVLLQKLKENGNKSPVLITSSIQAAKDNPYGLSKKAGEDLIFAYAAENGIKAYVYRLTNVFGKWCRPNYNSVTATFCHNIARGIPVTVNDENAKITLTYIDDIVEEFLSALCGSASTEGGFCIVPQTYETTVGRLASLLYSFNQSRKNLLVPDMGDPFEKKLYSTYLSYLPEEEFSYGLKMNTDHRGSFTEFLKTEERGQVSVNVSRPHITKGNHWHNTKCEKFLVVKGKGVIRFRKVGEQKILEYFVDGDNLKVVDIPPGFTHNIENLGDEDMVTVMWANEPFNPEKPDTFFLEV